MLARINPKARLFAVAAATIAVTGCTSGPVLMGQDTYMMTGTGAWSWTAGAEVKGTLYQEATKFCRSEGKEFMPLHSRQNDANMAGSWAHAELQFRCLTHGDPELARPNMQPAPDAVVKIE